MRRVTIKFLSFFLGALFGGSAVAAGPWYTGPLLAPAGHTIPRGHTNFEPYGFFTDNTGRYNNHGHLLHIPHSQSDVGNPIFTHGLTDTIDIQYGAPYVYNRFRNKSYHHLGDINAVLGYQLIEQGKARWRPDLRVTLQEIFATGKFNSLNPLNNGVDTTGLGSYQTGFNLNFQHRLQLTELNYLRTRLSLAYLIPLDVNLNGITGFGGSDTTSGRINPGNIYSIDLAGELNLTQNWVLVMEGYYINRQHTKFFGFPGFTSTGALAVVGHRQLQEVSLAPAIEYNFNENVGIIGGYWFSIAGQNATDFQAVVVALNIFI